MQKGRGRGADVCGSVARYAVELENVECSDDVNEYDSRERYEAEGVYIVA